MNSAQLVDMLITIVAPFVATGHIDLVDATIPTKRALEAVGLTIDSQAVYCAFQRGIAAAQPATTKKSRVWQEISDQLAITLAQVVIEGHLTKHQAMTILEIATQNMLALHGYDRVYREAEQQAQAV